LKPAVFWRVSATIINDDLFPAVTLDPAAVPAGEWRFAVIIARLSSAAVADTWVDLDLGGTATLSTDFLYYTPAQAAGLPSVPAPAQIRIAAGELTGSLILEAINDPDDESNETIVVSITGTNGEAIVDPSADQTTAIIVDDDRTAFLIGENFTGSRLDVNSNFIPPDTMGSVGETLWS
jgi:hypothetical protein